MQHSSKAHPCPACQRTHDGDCRFTTDLVLCHSGTDLRPGDTIDIAGQPWALIRHDGGFDSAAAVFRPHREDFKPTRSRIADGDRLAKRTIAAYSIRHFLDHFQQAWDLPDFHDLSPDALQNAFALIEATEAEGIVLKRSLVSVWRECTDLADLYRWRIDSCVKSIKAQAKDAHHFRRHYLGEAL